jgi:hypothetical protein
MGMDEICIWRGADAGQLQNDVKGNDTPCGVRPLKRAIFMYNIELPFLLEGLFQPTLGLCSASPPHQLNASS